MFKGPGEMVSRLTAWLRPLAGLLLFAAAFFILDAQLRAYSFHEVLAHTRTIPSGTVMVAVLLGAGSYAVMTVSDWLVLRRLGYAIRYAQIALTSFVANVFSLDLGLSVVGSSAIRFRLLSGFGIEAGDIARVIAFTTLSFWVGSLGTGGLVLAVTGMQLPGTLNLPMATTRPLGFAMTGVFILYAVWSVTRSSPVVVRGFAWSLPPLRITLAQLLIAASDFALAGGVLYVFLPVVPELTYWHVLGVFIAAQLLGVISSVPAGLGVFEGVCIALLSSHIPAPAVLGALIMYRFVYTLLPIFVALVFLGGFEASRRRTGLVSASRGVVTAYRRVAPRVFAVAALVAGSLLMVSSVLPPFVSGPVVADLGRIPDISASTAMLAGVALILVSRGLAFRTRAAYYVSEFLLGIGFISLTILSAHLATGGLLMLLMLALWLGRAGFDRPSPFGFGPASRSAAVVVVIAIALSAWFAVWIHGDGSDGASRIHGLLQSDAGLRSLRSLALAFGAIALFCLWRISRPALPAVRQPDAGTMLRARAVVAESPHAAANLALLGDKQFLFDEPSTAFVMYGVAGNSLIAMGDPVGPRARHEGLIWQFRELCDRHGAWPVFYEVGVDNLTTYLDLGLSLHKLGEHGRVDLARFSLDGSARKRFRQTIRRIERDGGTFEVIAPAASGRILPDLEAVSGQWLASKNTAEKGFSLGAFRRDYVAAMPVAVVRCRGRISAFSNIWLGAARAELAPDMMRFGDDAPNNVMEYLFIKLMLWGQQQGYRWFDLGMAPLAGLPQSHLASAWVRAGSFIFRHGEYFYNFEGVRAYKDKFQPVWEPRYLASPGGLALPRVLTQVSALVSGGLRRVVS